MIDFPLLALIILMILCMLLVYYNSNSREYMLNELYEFMPNGYGEKGQYYDNVHIEPIYKVNTV